MNEGVEVIQAVKCVQCNTLHYVDGTSYLKIEGKIVRRRGIRGQTQEQVQHLGASNKPTVLCDNHSCLLAFLRFDQ